MTFFLQIVDIFVSAVLQTATVLPFICASFFATHFFGVRLRSLL